MERRREGAGDPLVAPSQACQAQYAEVACYPRGLFFFGQVIGPVNGDGVEPKARGLRRGGLGLIE